MIGAVIKVAHPDGADIIQQVSKEVVIAGIYCKMQQLC
jgi:hypothetical protein